MIWHTSSIMQYHILTRISKYDTYVIWGEQIWPQQMYVYIYNALWYAKWIDEIYATFNLPNPWASTSQRKHVENNQKNLSLFKIVKGCYFGQSCGSSRWKGPFMGWPSLQLFKSCCLQWCQQINFPASQTWWSTQKPNHGTDPINQPISSASAICARIQHCRGQTSRSKEVQVQGNADYF